MAVIGNAGGGYATLVPNRDYLGASLIASNNILANYRDEKRQHDIDVANELDIQRQQRQDDIDRSEKWMAQHPFVVTGMTKIDAQNDANYQNAYNAYLEANKLYKETGDKSYLAAMNKINKDTDEISAFPQRFLDYEAQIAKGYEEGVYNPESTEEVGKNFDNYKGKVVTNVDAKGNKTFTLFKTNTDGTTTIDHENISEQEFYNLMTPRKAVFIDALDVPTGSKFKGKTFTQLYKDTLGKEIVTKDYKNGKIITTVGKQGAEEIAERMATEAINDPDYLYALYGKYNIPRTEENYKNKELIEGIRQKLKNTLYESEKDVVTIEPDNEALNRSLREREFTYKRKQDSFENSLKTNKDNPTATKIFRGQFSNDEAEKFNKNYGVTVKKGDRFVKPRVAEDSKLDILTITRVYKSTNKTTGKPIFETVIINKRKPTTDLIKKDSQYKIAQEIPLENSDYIDEGKGNLQIIGKRENPAAFAELASQLVDEKGKPYDNVNDAIKDLFPPAQKSVQQKKVLNSKNGMIIPPPK